MYDMFWNLNNNTLFGVYSFFVFTQCNCTIILGNKSNFTFLNFLMKLYIRFIVIVQSTGTDTMKCKVFI